MRIFVPGEHGKGVRILATGTYLPEQILTNTVLVARGAPMAAEEIDRMTGIRQRHEAGLHEATSDLATHAAQRALGRACVKAADVDRVVVATVSPDHMSPATACFVHRALGMVQAPAHDLTASCSGFLYALDLAARCIATGDRRVLAIAADIRTRFVDPTDRGTCALFGDGAVAALVGDEKPGTGVLAIGLFADGSGVHSVYVPAGGSREIASNETLANRRHFIRMQDGPAVYLAAVDGMISTANALLERLKISLNEIRLVVPHQPNRRILERLARLMRLRDDQLWINVDRTGNVSGASVGLALDEALRSGKLLPGDRVLLLAAGAGYTSGAALLEIDEALLRAVTS